MLATPLRLAVYQALIALAVCLLCTASCSRLGEATSGPSTSPSPTFQSPAAPPESSQAPDPTDSSVAIPGSAYALLSQIAFVTERDGDTIDVRLFGQRKGSVSASESAIVALDSSDAYSWITIVEPLGDGVSDVLAVDPETNEVELLAGNIDLGGEPQAALRTRGGDVVVIAGLAMGVVLLDTLSGVVTSVVPAYEPSDVDGPWERTPFYESPTGETVVSAICGPLTCSVDVIDLTTTSASRISKFVPQATTDRFVLGYESLESRSWEVLDLSSGSRAVVAPSIAAAYDGFPRDDGKFTAYGATSWAPQIDPVRRPVYAIDPMTLDASLLVDQDPEDWGYLFTRWTTPDWVLLQSRSNGMAKLVDTHSASQVIFDWEDALDGTVETAD